jgi:hypothetical protein
MAAPKGHPRWGGRQVGSVNKAVAEARARAADDGELPLDYMLRVMRDSESDQSRRDDMAKAAAPYMHARLQTTTHKGDPKNPVHVVSDDMPVVSAAEAYASALKKESEAGESSVH